MEKCKWLVFEGGRLVAGFVLRDDAEQFIEQCGCDTMKTVVAGEAERRSRLKLTARPGRRLGAPARRELTLANLMQAEPKRCSPRAIHHAKSNTPRDSRRHRREHLP
jgi:hypothetical protein